MENSALTEDGSHRIALFPTSNPSSQGEPSSGTKEHRIEAESTRLGAHGGASRQPNSQKQTPPVEEGEVRLVTIDTLGDQGDGIAKVEQGFIVIVAETQPGDQLGVEITNVKDSVAFGKPISDPSVR